MSPKPKDFKLKPKILQMPMAASVSSGTTTSPVVQSPPPTLIEFVTTVPTPLASELVALAPYIQAIRHLAQIISWESSWEESWLALAVWWAFCLLSEPTLRFFLPLAVAFVFTVRRWTSSTGTSSAISPPVTDSALHALVSDLTTIHALLPVSPVIASPLPPSLLVLRVLAFTYLPYLILTSFVGLRVCIAICGTLFMIHRAHWARHVRASITRSAHVRWAFYRLYSFVSGVPLPPPASPSPLEASTKIRPASVLADDTPKPSPPLRFLFTVYENQRWWMALDWTAALLPNERPSWCSSSLTPLPPPSAFPLPASTTAYVAVGKNGRAKRVARWTWEEPEWRVVVRKEGQEGVWRVEKTPPKDKDGPDESTGTAARMLRAARGRDNVISSSSGPAESPERIGEQHSSDPFLDPAAEDEVVTDPEGWLYGDNKWEGASSKGGMGKYTRFRRWTRIAVLTEIIELVGPGELGVLRDSSELGGYGTAASSIFGSAGTPSISGISPTLSSFSDLESQSAITAPEPPKDGKDGKDAGSTRNMLRQRLKAVVEGSSH
ncbi:integral peroxisomal membrane peroxin-domain-containing protein [Suillus paluster]|uniref:integral peroxisomal membrane peroxin-domain-containing protein n=1 Tax=Suillus paluster TaxID=48578 RepID=UPI001B87CC4D|nr:integral peroxisomal membrane peroxin-domain-containing protein [Suillus paluster]KAG1724093.1 integral peroxisomal membrane peroxin-domain-containing protein [Suillus paluster]